MTPSRLPQGSAVTGVFPSSVAAPVPVAEVVYPETDGKPLAEGTEQYVALTETVNKLQGRYHTRPDAVVIGNMLLYYEEGNPRASVAPDVFVVFGVEDRPRPSYLLWVEGKAPDFVLEVASESTWREDAGRKREVYARIGVTEYWRFDPTPDSHIMNPPLIGERLVAGAYAPIQVQDYGAREWRGYSAELGLEFRARAGHLELFDPETQVLLLDYAEQRAQAQLDRERRQRAQKRAQRAEERAQQAEERVQRAETQAQLDRERRQEAEIHIKSLEEEIRRLRGTTPADAA